MRGTWKSYFWKILSSKLNLDFIDSDIIIEQKEWIQIDEIIKRDWWNYFRKVEREVLESLTNINNNVIAVGWGMPCYFDNKNIIKSLWFVVWLNASSEYICSYLKKDKNIRPSITWKDFLEEIEDLLKERNWTYKEICNIEINLDQINDSEKLVQNIIESYKLFCK